MLGTLLIQLAVIASRADLEALLCNRVLKFMDALSGVVPYSPFIDFGQGNKEINGTGTIYFSSNLRMPRNCTVDHPDKNKKTINIPVIEDMIIFLDNGKWIAVNDCELNITVAVDKEGDQVSMKTTLQEISKLVNVTVNDSEDVKPEELEVLKNSLTKTISSLCEKFLSNSFSSSKVEIDQNLAFTLLQQVYQVFLTVL
ncbi:uncharacterized protein [Halyomorpha halys]|uniref:uncharacterized protein n=1 Tax=Halyomorpha halys TaxID=286706 RepID=UPI0006D52499|nr:uncharacterized protein LOC112211326 [Halyomorpha halys]XP_024218813.1 uncharacterized protein LOC106680695 [Halyomorpha halys]